MIISSSSVCFRVSIDAMDQLRAVVRDHELDSRRKRRLQLRDPLLDGFRRRRSTFSPARIDDDARRPLLPPRPDRRSPAASPDRSGLRRRRTRIGRAGELVGARRDPPQVLETPDVAPAAHHVLAAGPLDDAARRRRCCSLRTARPRCSSGSLYASELGRDRPSPDTASGSRRPRRPRRLPARPAASRTDTSPGTCGDPRGSSVPLLSTSAYSKHPSDARGVGTEVRC